MIDLYAINAKGLGSLQITSLFGMHMMWMKKRFELACVKRTRWEVYESTNAVSEKILQDPIRDWYKPIKLREEN